MPHKPSADADTLPSVRDMKTFGAVAKVGDYTIIHTGQRQGGRHNSRYPYELNRAGVAIDEFSTYREAIQTARKLVRDAS